MSPFLPTSLVERGSQALDVVIVTGDAYVDHPTFGAAVIGRWLQAHGYRVGIIAQPQREQDFAALGAPGLFFGVTAGNLDSMVAKYTSSRKPRSDDAYSPLGAPGLRPDRATLVYTSQLRHLFPGVPVVLGGIEASMRRLAHLDWWQDKIRASILADSKADLLVFGMGERPVLEIARRLAAGSSIRDCGDIPGTARLLGEKESLPPGDPVELPSLEALRAESSALGRATLLALRESNPLCAKPLIQRQDRRILWCSPPAMPLESSELDQVNELPYTRRVHPCHGERATVPALESVRASVLATRGCAGGCAFCALGLHQGKQVESRSTESILREIALLTRQKGWNGTITDIGGPTANLYGMGCGNENARKSCRRASCLYPSRCRFFQADHRAFRELLERAERVPGVKHLFIGSGIRHDLAIQDELFLERLACRHTSGRLTVAPEHVSATVLQAMRKPPIELFDRFHARFQAYSERAGLRQELVPYFLAAHPGSDPQAAIELALYLKRQNIRPRQVQLFLPTPGTLSTAMFHSGQDSESGAPLYVARSDRDRERQRAMLFWWKREEAGAIRDALRAWGRHDLIGSKAGCLVGW